MTSLMSNHGASRLHLPALMGLSDPVMPPLSGTVFKFANGVMFTIAWLAHPQRFAAEIWASSLLLFSFRSRLGCNSMLENKSRLTESPKHHWVPIMAVFYADSESDLRYSCACTAERRAFFLKAQKLYQFGNHENRRFSLCLAPSLFCALTHSGLKTNLIKKLAG